MIRIIINSLFLALCTELCTGIYADAAPPIFPGYSPSIFKSKTVRIKSECVDIYYGKNCKIEAVIKILNPTKASVEKNIGFPFKPDGSRRWDRDTSTLYDFVMSLNGENLKATETPSSRDFHRDTIFRYGWTCRFKPGLNTVKLAYHITPGPGNHGYQWEKAVHYFFTTAQDLPGKIDTVKVSVHFPESIAPKQILAETSPTGYEIREKEVHWEFTSFTPTFKTNIVLHLIDSKFFADMTRYEKVLSAPGTDNATKLKAAKFFASLAPVKGINMSVPYNFNRSYYEDTVLPNLNSNERGLFDSTYKLYKGPNFENYSVKEYSNFIKNDSLRRSVVAVMHRIGYFEKIQYPVIYKYVEGAKRLFREIVTSEPKNAVAWTAYIDNCYNIESGSCGPCLPWARSCDCSDLQKQVVSEAFRHCGTDSTISLWYRFLYRPNTFLPKIVEVERYEPPQANITIKIKHSEGSWSDKTLSPEELVILENAYTKSSSGSFVRSKTQVDEKTQLKLVEILGGCNLLQYQFCRERGKLQTRGK